MNNPDMSRTEAFWRRHCEQQGYSAYLIPTADPHGSEYLPEHWKVREWLSGFTGSAGLLVLTAHGHALWTDSRYWLQAAAHLEGTGIALMRDGDPATPTVTQWLKSLFAGEGRDAKPVLGYVGQMVSISLHDELSVLTDAGWRLKGENDPFDVFWTSRPGLPYAPVVEQPRELAGKATEDKMADIWQTLDEKADIDHYLLSDLSEIAWTLNLRGNDIQFNPVFMSYLLLHADRSATLFVDERQVSQAIRNHLAEKKVDIRPYEAVEEILSATAGRIGMDAETNIAVWTAMTQRATGGEHAILPSPVPMLRAIKNEAETEGFRRAMERDGVAMVHMLCRLDREGITSFGTELGFSRALEQERSRQDRYCSLSFETISGYGPHGAIVHYEPTPDSDVPLEPHGFLLVDSGAQYEDGTTDITRTIPLGPLTEEERTVYTLVLKGHIELANLRFPEGTCGLALDLAARRAMWAGGYDFGHGTGHGVGSRLCVHEGPQQIRKNIRACTTNVPFLPGMTITDEPGIYVTGKFGVRIENVLLVVSDRETPFGRFCRFESLTLCPIDLRPVRREMLTAEEVRYLNAYHAEVRRRLLPLIAEEEVRQWLIQVTEEIQ